MVFGKYLQWTVAAAVAITGSTAGAVAVADVVFDNGEPDLVEGFWSDFDYSDVDEGVITTQLADDFVLDPGASTITHVRWWGGYAWENTPPSLDGFYVILFFSPDSGKTMVPVHVFNASAAVRTPTGEVVTFPQGDYDVYMYEFEMAPLALAPGERYYLSVVNNTPGEDDDWGWATSAPEAGFVYRWEEGGEWRPTSGALAFQLLYMPPLATADVTPDNGGQITVDDKDSDLDGITLTIPPGAVSGPVTITVSPVTAPHPNEPQTIGFPVRFGPEGTVFDQPITVKYPLPAGIDPTQEVEVRFYDAEKRRWSDEGISNVRVVEENGVLYVYFDVTHFTVFAVTPKFDAGDVDLNGKVDAVDIQLVINEALGITNPAFDMDIDANGAIDAVDVQTVINRALDLLGFGR